MSLRARLLALVLMALLPAFALIVYHAANDQRRAGAEVKSTALRLMRQAAQNHEQLIDDAYDFVMHISRLPDLFRDAATCRHSIADSARRSPRFASVFVFDSTGTVLCSAEPAYPAVNFADRRWFKEAVQSGKFVASEYLIGRISTQPSVVFAAPVFDADGAARAVVGLSLQLYWINQIIEQSGLPAGSSFTIVDGSGTVLARQPDPDKWIGKTDTQRYLAGVISDHRREAAVDAIGLDGVDRIYAVKHLGERKGLQSWHLSVGIPREAVYGPTRAARARSLILMSIVAALVLATAWLGSGKLVVRPIRLLVDAGTRWGGGDLSARIRMEARRDEIGQLALAFDRMAESLQTREAERHRAEQSRAQLAAVVESTNDAIVSRTLDGTVTSWNKGAEKLFGYRPEEIMGRSIKTLLPQGERERLAENSEKLARGEPIVPYDAVRLRQDGVLIDVSVTVSPIVDESGNVIGVSTINRDISERKRAESEIKALHDINLAISSTLDLQTVSRILLEKIEGQLPYAASHIRLVDKATGNLEPVACRNIDEEQWKAGGTGFRHAVHKTILPSKRPMVIPNLQTDERVSRPEFYRQQGLVSYLGIPLIVNDEAIGVLSLLTRDLHAFTLREIRFAETLAKQASVAIYNSQLYEERQKLFEQLAGSEEHIRTLANGLIHARDELRLRASFENDPARFSAARAFKVGQGIVGKVAQSGEKIIFEDVQTDARYQQLSRTRTSGKHGYRFFAIFPIKGKSRNLGTVACIGTDRRQLVASETQLLEAMSDQLAVAIENSELYEDVSLKVAELQRKTAELEQANKVKDEFLGVVSHELRTPINVIMGYTSLFKEGVFGEIKPAQEDALAKIGRDSEDLLAMINSVLYATTLETEQGGIETQEFRPENLLAELRANYVVIVPRHLTLRWHYPANLPPLKTDRRKLRQILDNVIGNAVKFTEQGTITITVGVVGGGRKSEQSVKERENGFESGALGPHGSWLEFKITDTGSGISPDALTQIFEKFFQADSSETRRFGGVGMGLYIAKKFTARLGGTIEAESTVGRGSAFTVRIPAEL